MTQNAQPLNNNSDSKEVKESQETIEDSLVKKLETEKAFERVPREKPEKTTLSDKEIRLIAECAMNMMKDQYLRKMPSSPALDGYFDSLTALEPKKKVIDQKEFSTSVKVFGWLMLGGCIFYWFWFFFVFPDYSALFYTTYLTLILISLTCINKFESVFLNSITCLAVYGFIVITIYFIPVSIDIFSLIVGPLLHGAIGAFQLFLIFHKKIAISKRYLFWGYLFYLLFLSSFDTYSRIPLIVGMSNTISESLTKVFSFYALTISVVGIYFYKKKYGILIA